MKVKSIMIEAHQHPYQRTSNDTRQRIISAMQAGGDQDLVSRILNVKPWTVRRVMLKFYATGETDKGKHGGHKGKILTEAHCAYLRDLMAEDATISLARMRDQLEIVDGVQVSLTTIHNAIKGFAYSFKVLKKQAQAAVTPALMAERRVYSQWLMDSVIEHRNIVYLDEVGFTVTSRVNCGRALKNQPARLVVPSIRSRNITVMAAISRYGVVHYEILDGNGNGERFRQFLHGLQAELLERHPEPLLIMDNVNFHRMQAVVEEMAVLGLEYHYLPPYSPFFNPIENVFSQWKQHVRQQKPQDEDELQAAMNNVRNVVTVEHCNNYVAHTNRNCQRCLAGENFFDN